MIHSSILDRYRVSKGSKFRLADIDPSDTGGLDIGKDGAATALQADVETLSSMQERLYADGRWAVLMILQGMDTSGKDGVIKHVMSGVNPQGCEVHSFKAPSERELDHDYLWRTTLALPRRGNIGVFNRSYYEETIVVRVHPELLEKQRLPKKLVTDAIWEQRFEDIRDFERHLARNGTAPVKFFLHMSKEEQSKRLLARIDDKDKRWKFAPRDFEERQLWDSYMHAYEETIRHTSTPDAPWYVVPADRKWFARLVIAAVLIKQIEALHPRFPKLDDAHVQELETIRAGLLAETSKKGS